MSLDKTLIVDCPSATGVDEKSSSLASNTSLFTSIYKVAVLQAVGTPLSQVV